MKGDQRGKQPIFSYDHPKSLQKAAPITTPITTPVTSINIGGGGRSAAISSMIKKTEIDLMSLEKNPFGNYRQSLQNSGSRDSPNHGNSVNIMAKVEDLVVKKIGEFKEIFALEIKKNLGSNLGSPNLSEEEKKDIKFMKENFKTQQTTTDQIISHINQFAQALNEINLLMASHSEILSKYGQNETNASPDKTKNSLDEISYKQLEGKIKTVETQLLETRSMVKQLNESILTELKDNFKKSMKKFEQDQEVFKANLKDHHLQFDMLKSSLQNDMNDTKMLIMSNNKKFEDLNQDFLSFSAQIRSELMSLPKNKGNNNERENEVNPKWAEKILKLEGDVELMIKRNQSTEKKFDDFLLFKHNKDINEINEKIEEIKARVNDNNFKLDSPQKSGSGIFSPQREAAHMIDDERFNSIIEKTKKNIELALSNSPMRYEHLEKNVYESPYAVKNEFINNNNPSQTMASPNLIKNDNDNLNALSSLYQKESANIDSYKPLFNNYTESETLTLEEKLNIKKDLLGVPAHKSDLSMKKFSYSEGRDRQEQKPLFYDDEKLELQKKNSNEDKNANHRHKKSLDDYDVQYSKETSTDFSSKELVREFEEKKINFNIKEESLKEGKRENDNIIEEEPKIKNDKLLPGYDGNILNEDIGISNDEIVYHLDDEGFLMDEEGSYIVDENGQMIKLSEDHIDYLRKSNMIEDDKKNENN